MQQHVAFQRAEGAVLFASATLSYIVLGSNIWLFILLFFAIDAFMAGYLVNPKIGAVIYNIGHSLIAPLLLALIAFVTSNLLIASLSCIWFAHIGFDRAFGYGLKLATGFRHTHLGDIGKG
jgi:hypothetical protein